MTKSNDLAYPKLDLAYLKNNLSFDNIFLCFNFIAFPTKKVSDCFIRFTYEYYRRSKYKQAKLTASIPSILVPQ